MSNLNKPIVVACFPFDDRSGGNIALHYLTDRLRRMGVEAYMFPLLDEASFDATPPLRSLRRALTIREYVWGCVEAYVFPLLRKTPFDAAPWLRNLRRALTIRKYIWKCLPYKTNPAFDTPLAPLSAIRRGIVIYPEVVSGNPLGCANVARWILYTPRGFGVGEDFVKPIEGEETFYFQRSFIEHIDWVPRENVLRLQYFREDIFNDPGPVERAGICRMIRKGAATADSPLPGAEGAIMLDGKSNEEIAAIFKRTRLFYCHDAYTMYCDYAAMCGCLPIVVPLPGLSLEDWRPEADRQGIAYGDSPEQLESAARTRDGLFKRIKDLKRQEDGMLEHFVSRLAASFCHHDSREK